MTETGTFKELLNDSGLDPKSFIKRGISKRLDHFVSDWKEDTIKLRDSSKQETLLFPDIQEFPGALGWRDTGGQGGKAELVYSSFEEFFYKVPHLT